MEEVESACLRRSRWDGMEVAVNFFSRLVIRPVFMEYSQYRALNCNAQNSWQTSVGCLPVVQNTVSYVLLHHSIWMHCISLHSLHLHYPLIIPTLQGLSNLLPPIS